MDNSDKVVKIIAIVFYTICFVLFLVLGALIDALGFAAIVGGIIYGIAILITLIDDSEIDTPDDYFGSSHYGGGVHYVIPLPRPDDDWIHKNPITDEYYGMHGEFDLNDEARRVSEDIQQFHNCHPDADLSDHYYWEDILDAKTDGYLDDNT